MRLVVSGWWLVMAFAGGMVGREATAVASVSDDEFIRAAPDHWSFEGATSHQRFIPFGSNLVLQSAKDLDIFGSRYTEERYDQILAACEKLNITLLKVFLQLSNILPDPQMPGEVHIAPGYLEHLDNFLALCRKHHIRAEIALACWGGNYCTWWQEGGQYFGRTPWKSDAGIDSLEVLCRFWTEVAGRLKNNPAVFSYTPCVEWSIPNANLTWFPPNGHGPVIASEQGVWYWRAWIEAKYGTIEKLNAAWGTQFAGFGDVTVVNYAYDNPNRRYVEPEQKIFDYSNFRDWSTMRYFRPQIATGPGRRPQPHGHDQQSYALLGPLGRRRGTLPGDNAV